MLKFLLIVTKTITVDVRKEEEEDRVLVLVQGPEVREVPAVQKILHSKPRKANSSTAQQDIVQDTLRNHLAAAAAAAAALDLARVQQDLDKRRTDKEAAEVQEAAAAAEAHREEVAAEAAHREEVAAEAVHREEVAEQVILVLLAS